jgi:type II secretory pathway pseudopilin PulG
MPHPEQLAPQSSANPPGPNPEAGFVLLAVIFLTFLVLLSLAIAAPRVARSIQRDKELETIQRGLQYKRAIQLYYRKLGSYPSSIDQLENTNDIRFLRKRYKDPLTGKDDWKLVLYGQAHLHPLGFFGQPLSTIAGATAIGGGASSGMYAITPSNGNGSGVAGDLGTGLGNNSGAATGGNGSSGSPGSGSSGSSFGSSGSSFGSSGSSFGSSGSSFGSSGSSFGSSGSSFGSSSPTGGPTTGTSGPGTGTGFGSDSSTGSVGPFVGVVPPLNKTAIADYKLQSKYNKWEFNYDPAEDQALAAASLLGGGSNNLNGASSATPGSTGSSGSSNGFGSSGGFGSGSGSGFGSSSNGFGSSSGSGFGSSGSGSGSSGFGSSSNSGFGSSSSGSSFGSSNSNSSNSGSSNGSSGSNQQNPPQ